MTLINNRLWLTIGLTLIMIAVPLLSHASFQEDHSGYIFLQVEERGEAWYVLPDTVDGARIYLRSGDSAYRIMQGGLGISNADLAKIPIGLNDPIVPRADSDGDGLSDKLEEVLKTRLYSADSDGDGFDDYTEVVNGYDPLGSGKLPVDEELVMRLSGLPLIQVEEKGAAWYVNPRDNKRYYLPDGEAAFSIMHHLGLGVSNVDLAKFPIDEISSRPDVPKGSTICADNDFSCFTQHIADGKVVKMFDTQNLYSIFSDEEYSGDNYEQQTELIFYPTDGMNPPWLSLHHINASYTAVQAALSYADPRTGEEVEMEFRNMLLGLLGYRLECNVSNTDDLIDGVNSWAAMSPVSISLRWQDCRDNAKSLGIDSPFNVRQQLTLY